jgi:pyroglutamyl-peptidase
MKILITAFGPFEGFEVNPSQLLIEDLIKRKLNSKLNIDFTYQSLPVSFTYVENYIENLSKDFDLIIHIGVATNEKEIRLELCGQNLKSGTDIDNKTFHKEYIYPEEKTIYTSFPVNIINDIIENNKDTVKISKDAGEYLCNFIYYKSLYKFNDTIPVIFIHLADIFNQPDAPELTKQTNLVEDLITLYSNDQRSKAIIPT